MQKRWGCDEWVESEALGQQMQGFGRQVQNRSGRRKSGAEPGGLGETGAESERFGGKVVQNRSSLGESGAEAVGLRMKVVRNRRALAQQRQRFGNRTVRFVGKVMQNRSSYGWKWCETGVVSDR